jgi:hypothetical protein
MDNAGGVTHVKPVLIVQLISKEGKGAQVILITTAGKVGS